MYKRQVIDKIVARQKRNIYKNRSINKTHNSDTKYIPTEFTNLLPNTIKNVFKKHGFAVSFKTSNCILNALRPVTNRLVENCSGIYKIECEDCNNFYVGQTGRKFLDRYREHLPRGDTQKIKSNFALHLVNQNHSYSSFQSSFKPFHFCKKGRLIDALEEFEMYKLSLIHI